MHCGYWGGLLVCWLVFGGGGVVYFLFVLLGFFVYLLVWFFVIVLFVCFSFIIIIILFYFLPVIHSCKQNAGKNFHLQSLAFDSVRIPCILLKLYADNHSRHCLCFRQILNSCKIVSLSRRFHQ